MQDRTEYRVATVTRFEVVRSVCEVPGDGTSCGGSSVVGSFACREDAERAARLLADEDARRAADGPLVGDALRPAFSGREPGFPPVADADRVSRRDHPNPGARAQSAPSAGQVGDQEVAGG